MFDQFISAENGQSPETQSRPTGNTWATARRSSSSTNRHRYQSLTAPWPTVLHSSSTSPRDWAISGCDIAAFQTVIGRFCRSIYTALALIVTWS